MEDLRPYKRCKNDGCNKRTRDRLCFDCKTNQPAPDKQRFLKFKSKDEDRESYDFYHSKTWKLLRAEQLARAPYCQWPMPSGLPCLSTIKLNVDHKTPRKQNGKDTASNLQTLCHEHHNYKTSIESGNHFTKTPVHIICGPSGCGKTTYVQQRIVPGCLVWDMDSITAAISGNRTHYQPQSTINAALAIRTAYESIVLATPNVVAIYWIESAPTIQRRQYLRDTLRGDVYVFETASDICKQRIANDQERDSSYDWDNLVDEWWSKYVPSSLDIVLS